MDPIRENIGRSRGTNKGRSLDEFIRCRIILNIEGVYSNKEEEHKALRKCVYSIQFIFISNKNVKKFTVIIKLILQFNYVDIKCKKVYNVIMLRCQRS